MAGTFKNMVRNFQLAMCCIQNVATMFSSACAKFLARLTDVCLWTVVAKEDVNDVFRFAIHRLMNCKHFSIFHFDAVTFDNIATTLAVMAGVVAFGNEMFFLRQREVRIREKKLQIRRLSATRDQAATVHDHLHFWAFIQDFETFLNPREDVRILWIVRVYKGNDGIFLVVFIVRRC